MAKYVRDEERKPCHDCGCAVGEHHKGGCDMERCPKCDMQLIGCSCFIKYRNEEEDASAVRMETGTGIVAVLGPVELLDDDEPEDDDDDDSYFDVDEFDKYPREVWSDIAYEKERLYAEKNHLWSRWDDKLGWVKCEEAHPEAGADINTAMISMA